MSSVEPRSAAAAEWFGQPRGLTILFLTEMWEKFSFYGMRSLLVLYMTKHLAIAQQDASWIYGGYAALVYLTPVFGGVIADRWLGQRYAVILGGLIMAAGHFMMASENLFYIALVTIATGSGLYLPSLPSQIDSLYAHDDPRRKSAYNVYYVGINLGAFAAPLVVGTVGEAYSFHWGFAIAGFGMFVGLMTYLAGARYLPAEAARVPKLMAATEVKGIPDIDPVRRFAFLLGIAAIVVIFRGSYEQFGNTLTLWADQSVDRTATATLSIPVTWFQSLNPLLVFLLTPLLVMRWTRQARQGRELASGTKMSIGATIVGLSYLFIAAVALWSQQHGVRAPWPYMMFFIAAMTAGELYILPVGLGLFGRLAPKNLTATSIAVWFSAGVFGNLFAGWLGTLWSPLSHGIFFAVIGAVAFMAALLLALLAPTMTTVEHGV
jgi:proton-dependent oligopeptide transporter, POT family